MEGYYRKEVLSITFRPLSLHTDCGRGQKAIANSVSFPFLFYSDHKGNP